MANQYFLLLISLLDDLMSAYSLELQESNELPQHMSLESGLGGSEDYKFESEKKLYA